MKNFRNAILFTSAILATLISSCSPSSNIKDNIVGKYASTSENNYDSFKDTIEVRSTDEGKFDIQTIANWSAAKKDDPQRPNKNKKAGVWNNYGPGKVDEATLQVSDTTLRITEPMTGNVRILNIDLDKKTISELLGDGTKAIYHKVL